MAEARRLSSRNGASHAADVLASLDATVADAQRQLAANQIREAQRATERARGLLRLASATIARGKAEREATELHATADTKTDEAAEVRRQALVIEAELAQVEAALNQPPTPGLDPSTRPGVAGADSTPPPGSAGSHPPAPSSPASVPSSPETSNP